MGSQVTPRPRLLFLVTEDYYFVSHRLPLALAAQAAGFEVTVVTRVRDAGEAIRRAGIRLIAFENARSGLNPVRELHTLWRLIRLYRRERPDIVHHVAMKPVLYGSLAARCSGRPRVINALAGMGWLFTSASGAGRWLQRLVRLALRRAVMTGIALVQNPDDERLLQELGVPAARIRRIAGAGVDLQLFHATPPRPTTPAVVLPARLLWDKGVGEFVAAARLLRRQGVAARFLLAGPPDPFNPAAISGDQLAAWIRDGDIEYLGRVDDMPALLADCHIVCLPSYREGLPKSLTEAAAAGKAIVTTDVPGCRAVVHDGDNGLLVPPRDAEALAAALRRLIDDPVLRQQMGARGRARAEQEFGQASVIEQTLALYREAGA